MTAGRLKGLLIHEPRDSVYSTLLEAMAQLAHRMSLVIRPDISLSSEGEDVIGKLEPWLDCKVQTLQWPGTTLMGPRTAELLMYRMSPQVTAVIRDTVNGLFEWVDGYPEDPAFYRADGSLVLYATAHEREGEVILQPEEMDAVLTRSAGFGACVAWQMRTQLPGGPAL